LKKKEILQKLTHYKEQNKHKYEIIKIGIFGSAARDYMNDQSDIDVVVELAKPDLFYLIGIKQDLEEYFHRSIDIVRYRDQMNIFLKNRINAEAIYV
jgi:predicted nucleotidyltransferase